MKLIPFAALEHELTQLAAKFSRAAAAANTTVKLAGGGGGV